MTTSSHINIKHIFNYDGYQHRNTKWNKQTYILDKFKRTDQNTIFEEYNLYDTTLYFIIGSTL